MDSPITRRNLLGAGALVAGASACRTAPMTSETGTNKAEAAASSAEQDESDRLDELFADLTDRRGDSTPISAAEREPRRARLATLLSRAGFDAIVMEAGPTMDYLSGVSWGHSERPFLLTVLADGSWFWTAPAFEVPRAEKRIAKAPGGPAPVIGWDEHEYAYAPLAAALRERGVERLGIEPELRFFIADRLAKAHGRGRTASAADVVARLRGIKEPRELELLRAANELTQLAIGAVAERLEAGTTDYQLGAMMRRAQERLGLRGVWVLPLLGPGAALPHGGPEGRKLEKRDLILVDTGGGLHGYQSDNTRTWSFDGPPTAEIERGWNVVRDAQRKAFETMRPGVPCRAVDAAARAVIEAAGYGSGYETFAHRLGHGIGLRGHEEPYFDGGNELLMSPGMTFSDEPGIYLPGKFGIRIEDIVVVTEDGADHFGMWQTSVRSPHA